MKPSKQEATDKVFRSQIALHLIYEIDYPAKGGAKALVAIRGGDGAEGNGDIVMKGGEAGDFGGEVA